MKNTETKRCRNLRRVFIGMFIVCGYMLSTPFAYAYVDVEGKPELISMTALNLAFGTITEDHPVYRNTLFGIIYLILPLLGFFFMFFDKRSNAKNLVGIACGIIGSMSIALPIGFNENLAPGIGAVVSTIFYVFVTTLSAISVFVHIEDTRNSRSEENAPRLRSIRNP